MKYTCTSNEVLLHIIRTTFSKSMDLNLILCIIIRFPENENTKLRVLLQYCKQIVS